MSQIDHAKLIIGFIGAAALLSSILVGIIALRQLPVPASIDHIAIVSIGALGGALAVKKADNE